MSAEKLAESSFAPLMQVEVIEDEWERAKNEADIAVNQALSAKKEERAKAKIEKKADRLAEKFREKLEKISRHLDRYLNKDGRGDIQKITAELQQFAEKKAADLLGKNIITPSFQLKAPDGTPLPHYFTLRIRNGKVEVWHSQKPVTDWAYDH